MYHVLNGVPSIVSPHTLHTLSIYCFLEQYKAIHPKSTSLKAIFVLVFFYQICWLASEGSRSSMPLKLEKQIEHSELLLAFVIILLLDFSKAN
jgi:hypothetical protein